MIARASLAAAGVVAPIATIAALVANPAWVALAVAAWGALAGFAIRAQRLWPGVSALDARRAVVVAWAASLIAFVFGLFGHYAVAVDHALCGGGADATALSVAVASVVYLAAAVWALGTVRRAVWAWPTAVVVGWAVHLALLFVLPGTSGVCET